MHEKTSIYLISLFSEDKDETFELPMPASSMPYYLLGSNKANWQGNFYVSILKDESLDESNEPQTIAAQDYSLPIHKSFDINQI